MRQTTSRRPASDRAGFTLVELLVVIMIIGILISILVPVISKMRKAANEANTTNQIKTIREAIETYARDNNNYYPGPLSNDDVEGGGNPIGAVTMSENLVLGLLGGINPAKQYDPAAVGQGAINFIGSDRRRINPYLDVKAGHNALSKGRFADDNGVQANDTDVPEFVDRFPSPMPILYLRARVSAPGVMSALGDPKPYQYDLRQILPYTNSNIGGKTHGLRALGGFADPLDSNNPNNALPYFRHPQIPGADNLTGTPRQKDGYILISAGADGIYGTLDDICSWGNVREE